MKPLAPEPKQVLIISENQKYRKHDFG